MQFFLIEGVCLTFDSPRKPGKKDILTCAGYCNSYRINKCFFGSIEDQDAEN
jgi:hypothetical protein